MSGPKIFSSKWWQNKQISHEWCSRFCNEFFEQDPSLKNDIATHESVGAVFYNRPNGEIVPVGMTAIQQGNFIFWYHSSYLDRKDLPEISVTLPKRKERYVAEKMMLPFFDNLPAEGWFGKAQSVALGNEGDRRTEGHSNHMDYEPLADRYHRFMMFGRDYPGAVWATYIRNDPEIAAQHHQQIIEAALRSRSSIAGVQPKLLGVEDSQGHIRPVGYWEASTHIVKLPPLEYFPSLMEYEYMSIIATKALLPNDTVVDAKLTDLYLRDGSTKPVLAIKRFDRTAADGKVHFEDINQLLGKQNIDRYNAAYVDIANVIRKYMGHEGVKRFYARLICQFLLGNTDNHLKNFSMFYNATNNEWQLTPEYDLAPTVNYHMSALALFATVYRHNIFGGPAESKEQYTNLNVKALVSLGTEFGLRVDEVAGIIRELVANIPKAKQAVMGDPSDRLNQPAPSTKIGHHKGTSAVGHRKSDGPKKTAKQDFCDKMDGRAQKLFGTLDKYLQIKASRSSESRPDR